MAFRIFPKVDGTLDRQDFGPMAMMPFVKPEPNEYIVFRGQDGNIDYSDSVAVMQDADDSVTIEDQALPSSTIWHYVRCAVSQCGLLSGPSPVCIVRIDENGDMIPDTPNEVVSLIAQNLAGGKIRLRWRYSSYLQEVRPTGFRIYMDSGSGFDFDSPDDTVLYRKGRAGQYWWISNALTHEQLYKFCVRAYTTGKGQTLNSNFVSIRADSVGPAAITGIRATWVEV